MIRFFLHGWGSSAERFRSLWPAALLDPTAPFCFLDGGENDPLTGRRRWFPVSGTEATLARHVRERVAAVEAVIERELHACGAGARTPIRLIGHSQGGMLALALALRGRLNIASVDSYAAFLPGRERVHAVPGPAGASIRLHASRADEYVSLRNVEITAAHLRSVGLRDVELRVARSLPHAFSAAWLDWSQIASGEGAASGC